MQSPLHRFSRSTQRHLQRVRRERSFSHAGINVQPPVVSSVYARGSFIFSLYVLNESRNACLSVLSTFTRSMQSGKRGVIGILRKREKENVPRSILIPSSELLIIRCRSDLSSNRHCTIRYFYISDSNIVSSLYI